MNLAQCAQVCSRVTLLPSSALNFFVRPSFRQLMFSPEWLVNYLELWAFFLLSYVWKKLFWFSERKSLLKTTQNIWCVHPLFRHFECKQKTVCFKLFHTWTNIWQTHFCLPLNIQFYWVKHHPCLLYSDQKWFIQSLSFLWYHHGVWNSWPSFWSSWFKETFCENFQWKHWAFILRFGFLNFLDFLCGKKERVLQYLCTEHVNIINKLNNGIYRRMLINSLRLGWPSVRRRPSPGHRWW